MLVRNFPLFLSKTGTEALIETYSIAIYHVEYRT